MLAKKLCTHGSEYAEAFNFGPGEADTKSVEWIVNLFSQKWGEPVSRNVDEGHHPQEALLLQLDVSKAALRLDWRSVIGVSCLQLLNKIRGLMWKIQKHKLCGKKLTNWLKSMHLLL